MTDPNSIPYLFDDPDRESRPNIQTAEPLPMTPEEVSARGWDEVDVVFITGDAYVDAPSFANGLLARVLEADGFRVAVLSQPDWNSVDDFKKFGKPRLAFCVSAGNMDSMLNHYTANRKVRNDDAYSPGGKIGKRPDRATLSYCQRARQAFPGTPILTGGVEASLRRFAHYDYWSDKVKRSILMDAKPDLLLYGMGERPLLEVVRRLAKGESIRDIRDVRGTVYRLGHSEDLPEESDSLALIPSFDDVSYDEKIEKSRNEQKRAAVEGELNKLFPEIDELQEEIASREKQIVLHRNELRDVSEKYAKALAARETPDPALTERENELRKLLEEEAATIENLREKVKAKRERTAELKERAKELKKAPGRNEKEAKRLFVEMTKVIYDNLNPWCAKTLVQEHGEEAVVVNPPAFPLSEREMNAVYALPFTRKPHPSYKETIPAAEVVRATIQTHRGCFGGCSFCAITAHQGKFIQPRSEDAIIAEIDALAKEAGGNYVVSDLNAPTANMYRLAGKNQTACRNCRRVSCLCPQICPNLSVDQSAYVELLKRARELDSVKSVFIASGIRTDLAVFSEAFIKDLAAHHTGGHLKTAPEHVDNEVLRLMNKPSIENYEQFCAMFETASREAGKEQYCIPYLISAFPGCTVKAMIDVAVYLKEHDVRPEQVQDFIPAPFQLATCAYYTGIDPLTGEELHVPKTLRERAQQRALLFYYDPAYYEDVKTALREAGREDLIGYGENALIPPHGEKNLHNLPSSRARRFKRIAERDGKARDARRAEIADFERPDRPQRAERGEGDSRGKRVGRERSGEGGYRGGAKEFGRGGGSRGRFSGQGRSFDRDQPRERREGDRPFSGEFRRRSGAEGEDFRTQSDRGGFDSKERRGAPKRFEDRDSQRGAPRRFEDRDSRRGEGERGGFRGGKGGFGGRDGFRGGKGGAGKGGFGDRKGGGFKGGFKGGKGGGKPRSADQ